MSSHLKHSSKTTKVKSSARPEIKQANSHQSQVSQPKVQPTRSQLPSQEECDRLWDRYADGEIDLLTFLKLRDPYSDED